MLRWRLLASVCEGGDAVYIRGVDLLSVELVEERIEV
jgi:hypothetical protein